MATKSKAKASATVPEKLDALENLQKIDSEIDRLLIIRGELPLEVEDLEAEVEGLNKKVEKLNTELSDLETGISDYRNEQKDAQAAILSYKEKQENVRNNREFESINKEIEYQELEIQLLDKKVNEAKSNIEHKKEVIVEVEERAKKRSEDLAVKKSELQGIIEETEQKEEKLRKKSTTAYNKLDDHLQKAYDRLRKSAHNGLAVVPIDRGACGGCFQHIPPQRQIDIVQKKKIIACEGCGRILVPGDQPIDLGDKKKTKRKKSTARKRKTKKEEA